MNHKAHGPNGKLVGSRADDEVIADLVIAYDEALHTGNTLPDETTNEAELDPQVRERLETAKECLSLIERVRQLRQKETEILPGGVAAFFAGNAYSVTGDLRRIGRFEIIRELGRGSHGVVFLARDPALSREIALKVPRAEAILTPQLRSRFLREGKAAARLNHPNILPVHEAGEAGPICYLVQSYCAGLSLAAWLARETDSVPCELAARIVAELADGVDHAHQQGVLHRDIKPANVMLDPLAGATEDIATKNLSGLKICERRLAFTPKLTDFGLAKSLDDDPNTSATLGALGTAVYMPPEQAAGQLSLVGPRSDVYSLGALLYEILTRRPPIVGANQLETLRLIASEDPLPIRGLRPDVPSELEAICLKCLEKPPDQRFATAGDLAADLRRFMNGDAVTASPQGPLRRMLRRLRRQRARSIFGGVAMMLLTAGLVLSLTLMISSNRHGSTRQHAPPVDLQADYVAGLDGVAQGYLDSIDNRGDTKAAVRQLDKFLEYHRPEPGQADYRGFEWHYLWRLCHPEKVAKPFPKLFELKGHKGEIYYVSFSPDGRLLATAGQDRVGRIWETATGKLHATIVGHTNDVNWISFHPQAWWNRQVVTAGDDKTVRIWNCDTGKPDAVLSTVDARAVAVEVILVGDGHQPESHYEIVCGDDAGRLWSWDWGTRRVLHSTRAHAGRIQAICPFRTGGWWITASNDGSALTWSGASDASIHSHLMDAPISTVSCNSESTLVAFGVGRSLREMGAAQQRDAVGRQLGAQIAVTDLQTGTNWLTLIGPGSRVYESVRFCPGRCELVAASRNCDPQKGEQPLLLWDLPTRKYWKPIEGDHPACWCAALSPDGARLATAGTDGIVRVWDSSELPAGTRLPGSDGEPERPVGSIRYSPDGRRLLVPHWSLGLPGRGDSFVLWDMTGERPKPLDTERTMEKQFGSPAAGFSGDGRRIAVADLHASGKRFAGEIRVLEADSLGEIARSSGYDGVFRCLVMSHDGRTIAAITRDDPWKNARLYVWNIDQPAAKLFRQGEAIHFLTAALSPDGKLLATNEERVELFEFPSMRPVASLPFQLGICGAIAFSPDGKTLATGGEGGIIHLWDLGMGKNRADLRSDGHAILSLAFSPDGTRLASGLAGTPRVDLWHLKSGKRMAPLALPSDSQSVGDLAFSPDQRTLAAAGIGGAGCVFLFSLEPVDGHRE